MEKKFSVAISAQTNGYAVVINCYTINDEGHRVVVADSVVMAADIEAAMTAAQTFINSNG